jgi:hypothetical protein
MSVDAIAAAEVVTVFGCIESRFTALCPGVLDGRPIESAPDSGAAVVGPFDAMFGFVRHSRSRPARSCLCVVPATPMNDRSTASPGPPSHIPSGGLDALYLGSAPRRCRQSRVWAGGAQGIAASRRRCATAACPLAAGRASAWRRDPFTASLALGEWGAASGLRLTQSWPRARRIDFEGPRRGPAGRARHRVACSPPRELLVQFLVPRLPDRESPWWPA